MAFIDIAYVVTVPFLLLILLFSTPLWKRYTQALLATFNLLLILHAVFLARQVFGVVQLAKRMAMQLGLQSGRIPYELNVFTVRLSLIILLPFFFLVKKFRSSQLLSLLMLVLLYWNHPVFLWHSSAAYPKKMAQNV